MARIAFILADDFEDSEFRKPYDALKNAGHEIDVLGVKGGAKVKGKHGHEEVEIAAAASEKDPAGYDALVIPGGYSPDHLRMDRGVVRFVQGVVRAGKLVAAVCHGPQLLIEADAVEDKTLTSWPSVRTDLLNAGAKWVDKPVVVDGQLITSRKPEDLDAFGAAILERIQPAKLRSVG